MWKKSKGTGTPDDDEVAVKEEEMMGTKSTDPLLEAHPGVEQQEEPYVPMDTNQAPAPDRGYAESEAFQSRYDPDEPIFDSQRPPESFMTPHDPGHHAVPYATTNSLPPATYYDPLAEQQQPSFNDYGAGRGGSIMLETYHPSVHTVPHHSAGGGGGGSFLPHDPLASLGFGTDPHGSYQPVGTVHSSVPSMAGLPTSQPAGASPLSMSPRGAFYV